MGIDLGIKKVAWSVWEDGVLITAGAYDSDEALRQNQLADIGDIIALEAVGVDHVFIEETLIGNNRKYSIKLSQTMGAVLSALRGFLVYLVNVSTWKKETIGNGNAGKPLIRDYIDKLDSAYHDLCGDDQDRYDAACIGYYGVLIAERVELMEASR